MAEWRCTGGSLAMEALESYASLSSQSEILHFALKHHTFILVDIRAFLG